MKRALTLMVAALVGARLALAPMTYAEEGTQGSTTTHKHMTTKKKSGKHHSSKSSTGSSTSKASTGSSTSGESNQ